MAAAAEEFEYGELELVRLTTAASRRIAPLRVAESPVAFECVTTQVIRTNPGVPLAGNVVLGRVVHVYVRDDLIDQRLRADPERLAAIGRIGGLGYATTRDRFELPRGRAALEVADPLAD